MTTEEMDNVRKLAFDLLVEAGPLTTRQIIGCASSRTSAGGRQLRPWVAR